MSFHPLLRAYRWLFPLFLVVLPTPFALAEIPSRAMDDCPALAKSTYTDDWISARCRQNPQSPWQRVCEAIRTYKPRDWADNPPLLQSTLTVSFCEDLQQAGKGTSYGRAAQFAY